MQDKSVLPSDMSVEITPFSNYMHYTNDMAIELKKTLIKRLEKPYDTECQDYGDSNQIDCVNKCCMDVYRNNLDCLPNMNKYHTIILNSSNFHDERKLFCPDQLINNITNIEKSIQQYCDGLCGSPCMEIFYHANVVAKEKSIIVLAMNFYFQEKFYRKIEYTPKMSLIEFFINLVNIWNFWHGTSFIQVIALLATLSKKLTELSILKKMTAFVQISNFNRKSMIKIFSSTLALLFTAKFISLTIDYLQFSTNTKLNLIEYQNDVNYPYVSFVIQESMPNFPFNLLNFKSNFTMKPYNFVKIFSYLNSLKNKIPDSYFNNNFSTIELAEYWLDYFNATPKIILSKNLLENFYLDGISIFFTKNRQSV